MKKKTYPVSFWTDRYHFERLKERAERAGTTPNLYARELAEGALDDDQAQVLEGLSYLLARIEALHQEHKTLREDIRYDLRGIRLRLSRIEAAQHPNDEDIDEDSDDESDSEEGDDYQCSP